jgi:hypothetical protein
LLSRRRLVLSLIAAGLVALVSSARAETPWEELSDEDGVKVWRKDIEGSPIVAMRGKGLVDAPVDKVASVIYDTPRCPEWVAELTTSRVVKLVSTHERIVYQRVATSWPCDDREFVFEAKATFDKKTGELGFYMKSVEDDSVPRTDGVTRGNLIESTFFLTPDQSGQKTTLEVEVQADPMGSIPKSIVNFFQKSWPRDTIKAIRRQVTKPDVKLVDAVAAVMSDGGAPKPR